MMTLKQGRISWTKGDRARAKLEKKYLFAIAIDGVAVGEGSIAYMGVGDKALSKTFVELILRLIEEEATSPTPSIEVEVRTAGVK